VMQASVSIEDADVVENKKGSVPNGTGLSLFSIARTMWNFDIFTPVLGE